MQVWKLWKIYMMIKFLFKMKKKNIVMCRESSIIWFSMLYSKQS